MKLETTINPRKDGTVLARFGKEVLYTFAPGDDGALTCDVDNDEHVAFLLNTGNFYPADAESFEEAAALVAGDEAVEVPGDEGEPPADDEGDENAPLIEVPAKPGKKKGSK